MGDHTILIVDDEPHILRQLAFVLGREFEVRSAVDGVEALEYMRADRPAVVLLDVMMPKKNGYEVCQEIKADPTLSDIHVVLLTAKGQEADREKGFAMGADEFIVKPFSPAEIVSRMKQLLG